MSQQPETLTGQAALDALARETTPEGSLRYPRLSRPCDGCKAHPKGGRIKGEHGGFYGCFDTGVLPLPLDTAAVGPLLESIGADGQYEISISIMPLGLYRGQWRVQLRWGEQGFTVIDAKESFFSPILHGAMLAALLWADAQRKEQHD